MASTRIAIMIYSTHTIYAADIIRLSLKAKVSTQITLKNAFVQLAKAYSG